jgi:lipoprotein-anchoring transpeptidase ErfK/SrfK
MHRVSLGNTFNRLIRKYPILTRAQGKHIILVNISKQKLYLVKDAKVVKVYPVSTSKFGIGNKEGSNKTPLGLHRIVSKIGRNANRGEIFTARRRTGKIARRVRKVKEDLITTRILRLEGLEKRVNKGKGIDSFKRCIYIHGTPQEHLIGRPASHGCIRMKNKDIMQLFTLVPRHALVVIQK